MQTKLFGTDGIRGVANVEPMTAGTAMRVAMAAGSVIHGPGAGKLVVIGKDTRLSGYMLEPAMTAGFISVGFDVVLVGPMPTPAVAMLTRSLRADLGVVLSASHNPYSDNGIKLFGADGFKLSDGEEAEIEAAVAAGANGHLAKPESLGRARRLDDGHGRYIEFAKASFPRQMRLDGLRIVIDCAHGAAYRVAPAALWELGAEVVQIGVSPDGTNINLDCGATHPEALAAEVRRTRADIGIALDGDADRVILVDERGRVIDGDQIMAAIARNWLSEGRLTGGHVVSTVMSNLGLERFLEDLGIGLHRTKVGDRHVVERMRETGCNLGGEQSGHMILGDYATTGDGLITALQVLAILVAGERKASETLSVFEPVPQLLRNHRYTGRSNPLEQAAVQAAIKEGQIRLGPTGRLLVRKSGTEPLIRVMVEGSDETVNSAVAASIVGALGETGAET